MRVGIAEPGPGGPRAHLRRTSRAPAAGQAGPPVRQSWLRRQSCSCSVPMSCCSGSTRVSMQPSRAYGRRSSLTREPGAPTRGLSHGSPSPAPMKRRNHTVHRGSGPESFPGRPSSHTSSRCRSRGLEELVLLLMREPRSGCSAMSCTKVARIRGRSTLCYRSSGREHHINAK